MSSTLASSIHTGHRQRLKEQFLNGDLRDWPDHRILEFILFYAVPRGDTNPLAHRLIAQFGSLSGVLDAPISQLTRVEGVGEHSATFLKMMSSVCAVYTGKRAERKAVINTPADAFPFLTREFIGLKQECVYILCLDGKNHLLGVRKIAEGSINAATINLRRIVEEVATLHAARIYLAHNHVGSLPLPSLKDWESTASLYDVLQPIGIDLIDHLIFVDDEMISLRETQYGKHILLPL